MEAAAHGHSTLGIPKKVGEEFSKADKGKVKNLPKRKPHDHKTLGQKLYGGGEDGNG